MFTDISKILESSDKSSNDPAIVTPISLDKVGSVVVIEKGYEIHIEPHDTQNFILSQDLMLLPPVSNSLTLISNP